jgi:GDP-L-fucose synthase
LSFWSNRRIVVTGGAGFLGCHVVREVKGRGCAAVLVPRSKDYNLVSESAVDALYRDARPDIVLHLAASVGGIAANQRHPGKYLYENLMMGSLMMEFARRYDVEKFVGIGSVCAYPKFASVPFKEEEIWAGYPEETNASYGLAKKMMMVQTQAYRQEYDFNSIHLLMVNLYGPGDDFDPQTSHVIPALIRRAREAKERGESELVVWGDGSPTREFLYVEDAARGILLAAEHYDSAEPVNLGSGQEISIRDLADKICHFVGFEGHIVWDVSKPNGQPRRCLDVSRAEDRFGFRATTSFDLGLRKTIEWFETTSAPLPAVTLSRK